MRQEVPADEDLLGEPACPGKQPFPLQSPAQRHRDRIGPGPASTRAAGESTAGRRVPDAGRPAPPPRRLFGHRSRYPEPPCRTFRIRVHPAVRERNPPPAAPPGGGEPGRGGRGASAAGRRRHDAAGSGAGPRGACSRLVLRVVLLLGAVAGITISPHRRDRPRQGQRPGARPEGDRGHPPCRFDLALRRETSEELQRLRQAVRGGRERRQQRRHHDPPAEFQRPPCGVAFHPAKHLRAGCSGGRPLEQDRRGAGRRAEPARPGHQTGLRDPD